jgi:hypothetical protein
MKDEALKLALKALRFAGDDGYQNEVSQQAITAIKQALAAPVQPSHETLMAGYKVACAFGVYESQAFNLAEKMFAAMKSAAPENEKKHD